MLEERVIWVLSSLTRFGSFLGLFPWAFHESGISGTWNLIYSNKPSQKCRFYHYMAISTLHVFYRIILLIFWTHQIRQEVDRPTVMLQILFLYTIILQALVSHLHFFLQPFRVGYYYNCLFKLNKIQGKTRNLSVFLR